MQRTKEKPTADGEKPISRNQFLFKRADLGNLDELENDLWEAADQLRANSKLTSNEYCMPLLGVIFLRHANNRYEAALEQIKADQESGAMPKRALVKGDFVKRRALMLPQKARYDYLLKLPKDSNLGAALVEAMNAIESDFEPLAGQLPKEYDRFETKLLEDLLRIFDSAALREASGDVFGRIYEYFLMKFAIQGAQDNGEFFTPPSIVQTIVSVIEPDHGVVFDPACGSGGMFVQSSHFIEHEGLDTMQRVTFYGQERTATTIRLAKMNLAVHGLEGDIREANTFYEDVHQLKNGKPLWSNCDFVMANPPFNVDMVDAERVKDDRRLPFGLPGVNKQKKVNNANYLWMSYFYSYLGPKGRAGFVMSSQASSAGYGEAEVRRKIVETGDVDVMIAIRPNFFYTRTVPCELWFFDKGKSIAQKNQILMIDAREIYRKVTRKIYDFTPEQLSNLSAIVWLYRGESERYLALIKNYFVHMYDASQRIKAALLAFQDTVGDYNQTISTFGKQATKSEVYTEFVDSFKSYQVDTTALLKKLDQVVLQDANRSLLTNDQQHAARNVFEPIAEALRGLIKQVDLIYKLAARTIQLASESDQSITDDEVRANTFDRRNCNKAVKDLDEQRKLTVDALKGAVYLNRQIVWLQDRFPEAAYKDVPGLCRIVTRENVEEHDWSLSPVHYVGVAPHTVAEEFDFEEALRDIHVELTGLNEEAALLAAQIAQNFEDLGV